MLIHFYSYLEFKYEFRISNILFNIKLKEAHFSFVIYHSDITDQSVCSTKGPFSYSFSSNKFSLIMFSEKFCSSRLFCRHQLL